MGRGFSSVFTCSTDKLPLSVIFLFTIPFSPLLQSVQKTSMISPPSFREGKTTKISMSKEKKFPER